MIARFVFANVKWEPHIDLPLMGDLRVGDTVTLKAVLIKTNAGRTHRMVVDGSVKVVAVLTDLKIRRRIVRVEALMPTGWETPKAVKTKLTKPPKRSPHAH